MIARRGYAESFDARPLRKRRLAAAVVLLLVLSVQAFDLRADLLFRSVEQVNGQQRWSPIRSYGNPSDVAYLRVSARGAAAPAEEVRVFLSGQIMPEDVNSAEVMAGLLGSGRQKIADNSVWFDSYGGDVDAAMELGRRLRKLGVFALIGKNDQCMSACVFAFMGGERRIVAGRLGIHRPYFPTTQDSPDRAARFRHLQQTTRDYIEEMDFPYSLYEAVMLVPPESMQILGREDLKKFYLEGISPSSEDIADAASARRLGLTMFDYLQRKAKAPACAFPVGDQGQCEDQARQAAANGSAADDPGSMQKGAAASAGPAAERGTGDAQGTGASRATTRNAAGPS